MNQRKLMSRVMMILTGAAAVLVVGVLVLILSYILAQGFSSLSLQFLIDRPRPVGEGGGVGNAILGSFLLWLVASLMGLPLGIAAGIYLSEFGDNHWGQVVRFVADTLTGVPSIVVGVFIYALIVLRQQHFSAFAGALSLAVIMFPIVARTTEEMLRLVPQNLREGALALGAPEWRVAWDIVLPAAAPGIATGAVLAIARIAGETAPLLFTALGNRRFSFYLDQPVASLTVQIYNYAISPFEEWHKMAWAATLVLIALMLGLNLAVRLLLRPKS